MNVASSISVVFVWGSVSIAYLRYWMWWVKSIESVTPLIAHSQATYA